MDVKQKIENLKLRLKELDSQKVQGIITPEDHADLLLALEKELREIEDLILNDTDI